MSYQYNLCQYDFYNTRLDNAEYRPVVPGSIIIGSEMRVTYISSLEFNGDSTSTPIQRFLQILGKCSPALSNFSSCARLSQNIRVGIRYFPFTFTPRKHSFRSKAFPYSSIANVYKPIACASLGSSSIRSKASFSNRLHTSKS